MNVTNELARKKSQAERAQMFACERADLSFTPVDTRN